MAIRKKANSASSLDASVGVQTERRQGIPMLAIAVILLALCTAGFLKLKEVLMPPKQAEIRKNAETIVEKVAKHLAINPQERPRIATIEDIATLRAQNPSFYQGAENGDRVLIWSDKVVLYSTNRDIILSVIPLNIFASTPTSTSSPEPVIAIEATSTPEIATIEVRNGSGTPGLGKTIGAKFKEIGLNVIHVTTAQGNTYPETVLYSPSGKSFPKTIEAIASMVHATTVPALPEERDLKGDIVVIVGADQI